MLRLSPLPQAIPPLGKHHFFAFMLLTEHPQEWLRNNPDDLPTLESFTRLDPDRDCRRGLGATGPRVLSILGA